MGPAHTGSAGAAGDPAPGGMLTVRRVLRGQNARMLGALAGQRLVTGGQVSRLGSRSKRCDQKEIRAAGATAEDH